MDEGFLVLGLKGSLDREEISNLIKRALEQWAS
jgi:hypothetical protein